MSNFWFRKSLHPQIKPELGFAGFYLVCIGCYWESMFQTKARHWTSEPNVSRSGTIGSCLAWTWGLRSYPGALWSCLATRLARTFRWRGSCLLLWLSLVMFWDRAATLGAQRYRQISINLDVYSLSNICYYTDKYQFTNLKILQNVKDLRAKKSNWVTSVPEARKVFPYLGIRWAPYLILFTSMTSYLVVRLSFNGIYYWAGISRSHRREPLSPGFWRLHFL
jgi:hypothetical protein